MRLLQGQRIRSEALNSATITFGAGLETELSH